MNDNFEKVFQTEKNDNVFELRNLDTFSYGKIDFLKVLLDDEYLLFTEQNVDYLINNVKKIVCQFNLNDNIKKEKFRYFRDKILSLFDTYYVFSVDGINVRWDLFNEHFIEYYNQAIFHIDNRITQKRKESNIQYNEISKAIVVAHYNENIEWFKNLEVDCDKKIYSKTLSEYNFVPKNSGLDAPCYMKYVIDNYDNLPDKTLFLHGHSDSVHQDYPSSYICKHVNWGLDDFFSVNKREWYQELSPDFEMTNGGYSWVKDNWQMFQGELKFPEKLVFYQGSQFVVDKKLFLQYKRDFWINLYNWIQDTELPMFISSRILEYTWHYILTKNPIEKKVSNIDLWI